MKFYNSLVIASSLLGGIQAQPVEDRGIVVAHLIFHGGPASYDLFVPTDGTPVPTNNDISVSIIDTPNYDAISLCTFYTSGPKALVGSVTPQGLKQITVGPPQPILSVSCRAE
ncbi:hypothetical protein GGS24DRAFT_505375 [Hypoxylon argillaceum]|nr:hypothetical protein GGS24DRAFT_505375 [Hypoxylon argillaceum]KAI1147960.1 hypothetical protein F4825DRAFT_454952 [Nemania diffusa]